MADFYCKTIILLQNENTKHESVIGSVGVLGNKRKRQMKVSVPV